MEDILNTLCDFSVTENVTSTVVQHPRYSRSKKALLEASQEERRRTLLDIQKKRRELTLNSRRQDVEEEASDEEQVVERKPRRSSEFPDDYAKDLRDVIEGNCPRLYSTMKNVLMASEWLIEVPADLETQWMFTLCPIGKRTLVLAARGKTMAFTKTGHPVSTFSSNLPGSGSSHDWMTILDCIVSLSTRTYYVLDVICWRGQGMLDCEKECRVYYAKSRLSEMKDEVSETSDRNFYRFVPLEYHSCERKTLENVMSSPGPFFEGNVGLDGLLFYHKAGAYASGQTPLSLWLKPHMLPDILGIPVNPVHSKNELEMTADDMELDTKKKGKNRSRKSRDVAMGEVDESSTDSLEVNIE